MPKLIPFLLFEGNCAEAMAFYRSCLGGELSITRVGDMGNQAPPELREMPFGTYGHLADKFAVHWFFRGDRIDATAYTQATG